MNFYQKYILPRCINLVLQQKNLEKERIDLIKHASGVVLEIGFGSGLNLPFYENVSRLYAVDTSRELWDLAVERVKKTLFNVEFIEASAEKIPLPDHTVDTVVSTWTLCSIPNPELALQEVKRVLKPGGNFIFVEHGKAPNPIIAKLQKQLTPAWKVIAGGCRLDRQPDIMLAQAGFERMDLTSDARGLQLLGYFYKGSAMSK